MKKVLLIIAILIFGIVLRAQTTPDPANKIMAAAYKQAAKEKKNVMLIFHASWCGWCKKLDASINDSTCKDFFDKSYVIVHLTIMENSDKKQLENPGAIDIFNENGGSGGGVPYFLFYDKNGKLLADSKMKPTKGGPDAKLVNMGCPTEVDEIAAFVEILKKTSKITDIDIAAITK
jgi:thioredoxin-related protein